MTNERLTLHEGEGSSSLKRDLVDFGGFIEDAEIDAKKIPEKDMKTRLLEVGHFTSNFFGDHPGQWSEADVKTMYALIVRAGALGSNYDLKEATGYMRLALTELSKHAKKLADKSFEAKLSYEKDNYKFAYLIDARWLGEAGLKKMDAISKMISEWGKTVTTNNPGTLENFDYVFSNLDAWLDEYTGKILDGSESKKVANAREKIKANLAIKFYVGLVSNPKIGLSEKKKVIEFSESISSKIPRLFGGERVAMAEVVGAQLDGKHRKVGAKGKKVEKKFRGPRTASERVREVEHKSLSVASFNSEDVVLFDYKEGAEVQLVMPDAMKVQLNSIALIGDLAETLLNAEKIDSKVSNQVVAEMNYLQNEIVSYYTSEDYDGKTPFNLEAELAPLMSGGRLKDFVNAVKKIALSPARTSGMLYRTELLKLLSGKSLNDMSEVKMAGFAIAWIQRNVFEDHMSARGLMAKLLHKDVMAAREKLPPEVKEQLYRTAYNDARKSITSMLSNGDVRGNFRKNFKKRYLKDNHKMPANAQVDAAYGRFFSSLFESQHMSLYDNYLTSAAFSDKYMKAQTYGVDKNIHEEFCDSTNPNNDFFKLSDEGRAVLAGVTKEVLIMAAAMIVTVGVGVAARLVTAGIRGLSMIKNATMMARYAAEAAMFTGTVAVEAGAFYDVNAVLHGEATIAGTALVEGNWAKAGIMLASEMPMFALLGGAHYAAGFAKMGVSGEAKALMAAAKKYPEHAKSIKNILALAKSNPGKAILAMAEALEKGGLPKEIAQRFGRAIENVNIIGAQYRGVLGKISDPFVKKALGVLVVDLNFDATAIMLGSYLKEKIHPTEGQEMISAEERGAIEAVLFEYGKSYLMAAGFKGTFHGVGKLARKVPEFLPQGVRERLIGTYKNAKGEFIDREGLINMLRSKLEVGGFDEALSQMEKAKVLILTIEDVLLFTSELPETAAKKFLSTCERMMKPSERQLVADTMKAMGKQSVLPEGFTSGKPEMPMDLLRRQADFVGKLITARVLALVLEVFSPKAATPPADRPVAAAFESPTAESVAKRPNASKDSGVVLVNPEAKTPEEAFKDFDEFYFASNSQDSIFAGMEKAGVSPDKINALKTAYTSIPDLVRNYCRIFGTNVDGQLVVSVAIDQQGFAKKVGYDAETGKMDVQEGKELAEITGMKNVQHAGFGPGWLVLGAWVFQAIIRGIGRKIRGKTIIKKIDENTSESSPPSFWGGFGDGIIWPIAGLWKLGGRLISGRKAEALPAPTMPTLADVMADKKGEGDYLGLNKGSHAALSAFHKDLGPIFTLAEFATPNEAISLFESLVRWKYFKLRLAEIELELPGVNKKIPEKSLELTTISSELATLESEATRLVSKMEEKNLTEGESRARTALFTANKEAISAKKAEKVALEKEIKELNEKKKALETEASSVKAKMDELTPEDLEFPITGVSGGAEGERLLRKNIEGLLKKEGIAGNDRKIVLEIVDDLVQSIKVDSDPNGSYRKIRQLETRIKAREKTPEYVRARRIVESIDAVETVSEYKAEARKIERPQKVVDEYEGLQKEYDRNEDKGSNRARNILQWLRDNQAKYDSRKAELEANSDASDYVEANKAKYQEALKKLPNPAPTAEEVANARKVIEDYDRLVAQRDAELAKASRGARLSLRADQRAFLRKHPNIKRVLGKILKFVMWAAIIGGGGWLLKKGWDAIPDPNKPAEAGEGDAPAPEPKPPSPPLETPSSAPTNGTPDDINPTNADKDKGTPSLEAPKVKSPAGESEGEEEAAPSVESEGEEEAAPSVESEGEEEAAPSVESEGEEEAAPSVESIGKQIRAAKARALERKKARKSNK